MAKFKDPAVPTVQTSVRMPEELLRRLTAIAQAQGIATNSLMCIILGRAARDGVEL